MTISRSSDFLVINSRMRIKWRNGSSFREEAITWLRLADDFEFILGDGSGMGGRAGVPVGRSMI